jgi:ribosomal protein S18 acetylase RimI-like enzyme
MKVEVDNGPVKAKVTVLTATRSHAPYIMQITRDAFQKYVAEAKIPGTIDALSESLDDVIREIETKKVFIAEVDKMPAGSIRITVSNDKTAYISRFGVLMKYQSMGIGRALMDEALKYLTEEGVTSTSLHTSSNYKYLVDFYLQYGFTIQEITHDRGYPRALMKREH